MKLTEKQVHLLFKIGVWSKGIDGALEMIVGFALLFTSPGSLRNLVGWLTQGELQEDPTDFVATHLVEFFHHLSISTKHFASAYLLVYGITKMGLAAGLLRGKLWSYPTALAALGIFLCYQTYRMKRRRSTLNVMTRRSIFAATTVGKSFCPPPPVPSRRARL